MAFIPTNKPHKNTETEKSKSKGKSATNISDFTSVCRTSLLCGNTAGKIVGQTFPSDQTFSRLKFKLNRHLNAIT